MHARNLLVAGTGAFWMLMPGSEALSAAEVPPPLLTVSHQGGEARITFTGTLLSSETPVGPWVAVSNAASPYTPDLAQTQRFYRATVPSFQSIFSESSVAPLTLTGPFQAYFDLAYAGLPDGMIPPVREKPYFAGSLAMTNIILPVSIRVRGNSSLQECPFPKLKFKVAKEDRPGTPFEDAREVKIGTHCADGGTGTIGRLRDQIAAYREVVAYELLGEMGFIAPRVRRAKIEYQDTTPATNANSIVGWNLTREALLLEDIEVVAARFGARPLTDEELALLTDAAFDAQTRTDLQLFNALIGNWDYSLANENRGVWNTDVLQTPDKLLLVAGDFDLASIVTGVVRASSPRDYHPELGAVEREARYRVEGIQARAGSEVFSAGKRRFLEKRSALESRIVDANLDEPGRTNAVRHVVAFYDALSNTGKLAAEKPAELSH